MHPLSKIESVVSGVVVGVIAVVGAIAVVGVVAVVGVFAFAAFATFATFAAFAAFAAFATFATFAAVFAFEVSNEGINVFFKRAAEILLAIFAPCCEVFIFHFANFVHSFFVEAKAFGDRLDDLFEEDFFGLVVLAVVVVATMLAILTAVVVFVLLVVAHEFSNLRLDSCAEVLVAISAPCVPLLIVHFAHLLHGLFFDTEFLAERLDDLIHNDFIVVVVVVAAHAVIAVVAVVAVFLHAVLHDTCLVIRGEVDGICGSNDKSCNVRFHRCF